MKKLFCAILALLMCLCCTACVAEEPAKEISPQISQMKAICELATTKCYYHNVAKYYEEDAVGFWPFIYDIHFWVEYSGIVTIGIDTSQVKIEVDGDTVSISIPPAKVMGCKVDPDTLNKDSFIVAADSADVTVEYEQKAFQDAQTKMLQAAENDSILLANAQQRAQKLLEDYVKNIGELVGKTYHIEWIYVGDSTVVPTQSEAESA